MIIINIFMPVISKSLIFSLGFSQCFKLYQLPARHVFLSDSVHFTLIFKSYHFFFLFKSVPLLKGFLQISKCIITSSYPSQNLLKNSIDELICKAEIETQM